MPTKGFITNNGILLQPDESLHEILIEPGFKFGDNPRPDKKLKCYRKVQVGDKVLLNIGIGSTLPDHQLISHVPEPAKNRSVKLEINLRPAQQTVFELLAAAFAGDIVESGVMLKLEPGLGKTYIAGKMVDHIGCNTLVITPKASVMESWKKMLTACGIDYGEYSGKRKVDRPVMLMNIKSAINDSFSFPKGQTTEISARDYFERFGFVIYDECHNYTSPCYSQILWRTCFRYRLGLSATPQYAKEFEPFLYRNIGPIFDGNDYFDDDVKWTGTVQVIKYTGPPEFTEPVYLNGTIFAGEMVKKFEADPHRHALVMSEIRKLYADGYNIIVFAEHVSYCQRIVDESISDMLSPDEAVRLTGGIKSDKLFLAQSARIIVATYSYAGEGVSYDHMDAIVLATPRRSKTEQTISRVLRSGGDTSIRRIFIDIVDTCTNNFKRQYTVRKQVFLHFRFDIKERKIGWREY